MRFSCMRQGALHSRPNVAGLHGREFLSLAGSRGHETTINHWKMGTTSLAVRKIPSILRFLGYSPVPSSGSFTRKARQQPEVWQEMARNLGVDTSTIRSR